MSDRRHLAWHALSSPPELGRSAAALIVVIVITVAWGGCLAGGWEVAHGGEGEGGRKRERSDDLPHMKHVNVVRSGRPSRVAHGHQFARD